MPVLLPRAVKRVIKLLINPVEYFEPKYGLNLAPYLERKHLYGIHHLGRYYWARMVLPEYQPKRILDIACGAGYGSYLLATGLPQAHIVGADYDSRAVRRARQTYSAPNLEYRSGDLVTWLSDKDPLGQYDAVVSFETIEHLPHREIGLMRLTENLSDQGVLLLSTPCGFENSQLDPSNPHHKIEYSYHDLKKLLRRYFRVVLAPEDGTLPGMDFWQNTINRDQAFYRNLGNPLVCIEPIRV
jgi:2-polyprenyl-3-methyl-5-hydroxy-6-metoxy-1,4-benzoquinol methylase